MKVNLIKDDFNYPKNFFNLLSTGKENEDGSFEIILYQDKNDIPLSVEISNRTRIVSELSNSIEKVYIKNEEYFKKLKEINLNNSYNEKNINAHKKNSLKKKSMIQTALYDTMKKRNFAKIKTRLIQWIFSIRYLI